MREKSSDVPADVHSNHGSDDDVRAQAGKGRTQQFQQSMYFRGVTPSVTPNEIR